MRQTTGKAPPRERIRLLIADDHVLILEGLAATIGRQDDMTVVAKAGDGREAVELWKTHRPDVSLLDLPPYNVQNATTQWHPELREDAVVPTQWRQITNTTHN